MIDPGLASKVVLVTGANNPHGLGAAIAGGFAAEGASVFITWLRQPTARYGVAVDEANAATEPGEAFDRARNAEAADAVLAKLRSLGGTVGAMETDLADPAVIPLLLDRVEAALGPVDVLVNNAAHSTSDTIGPTLTTATDWPGRSRAAIDAASHDRHFAVSSRAVALTMAEYARRHVTRGATWDRTVNISTDAADCFPGEVSYGASKAALEAYSRSAALELGPYGITVNIVAPGPIQTGWIPPDAEPLIVENIPLERLGRPADVADVVVFLASDQARWVTGQRLFVGGGHRV